MTTCAPPPQDSTPVVRQAHGPLPSDIRLQAGGARIRRYLAHAASRPDDDGAPSGAAPSAEEARRLYKWGGQFSAVLTEMRGRFGGDLDQYLIYVVFMLAEHGRGPGPGGLNVFSVAEITGIPRETVRRKLAAMAARGEVRRSEDGLYHPGPAASLDGFFRDLARLV